MRKIVSIFLVAVSFLSCKKNYKVLVPDTSAWELFNTPAALPLNSNTTLAMEGVYNLTTAANDFGQLVAIKWSYTIVGIDTLYKLSGFFGKDIAYFICTGKQLNGAILLNGYWRKMAGIETGIIHMTINSAEGAEILLGANPIVNAGSVTINGTYGNEQELPNKPIAFTFLRKLNNAPGGFQILAHRSGGRTSDLLSVSENSVEMILKTAAFGSTGIEIDVRFTRDGIPILYHDNTLNLREVQKSGLVGPIENYTYEQLSTFVRLIHGEKIPTLREALNTVVYKTPLNFVWLDTKYIGSIAPVHALQKEFIQKAAAQGRKLQIVIGLPGQEQFNQFLSLPDFATTPSLCELSIEDAAKANSKVWAPRFTEGTQNDQVAVAHAQGRLAFVWTVDVPDFIKRFVNEGHFDGILSNFPSCVAYHHYVHQ
jgi:glycerophosphoryl diester phosphodiesterase